MTTKDLPLDEEHLASLMDEETLEALEASESFAGFLDLDDASILITSHDSGEGKVLLRGPVRPHDLTLQFGLPMRVESATVN